jgi:hypothetical protein
MKPSPVPPDAKVGIVLATHGSVPYIRTHLECLKRHESNVKVLIHDDSSPQGDELRALARVYGAEFVSTDGRRVPTVGDLSAFSEGLKWGERHGLDVVVKCSRSFIADRPWSRELVNLLHNTGYVTATGPCATFNIGFRSEWVAMHVNSWIDAGTAQELSGIVLANREYGFPEAFYHNKAREVHRFVHPIGGAFYGDLSNSQCDFTIRSEQFYPRPENYNAFAWFAGLLGLGRSQKRADVLWHDASSDVDYAELAMKYGLPYQPADFTRIPGQ